MHILSCAVDEADLQAESFSSGNGLKESVSGDYGQTAAPLILDGLRGLKSVSCRYFLGANRQFEGPHLLAQEESADAV